MTARFPGVQFSKYVMNYDADQPNTVEAVSTCESSPLYHRETALTRPHHRYPPRDDGDPPCIFAA